ncbi:MAG: hypothetical protein ACI8PZ_000866 [Myxococcota bacterium]|jgi:hypothetical protein
MTPARTLAILAVVALAGCSDSDIGFTDNTAAEGVSQPDIAITPMSLDFGAGMAGEMLRGVFTVSNEGGEPLEVSSILLDHPSFHLVDPGPSFVLQPGESQPVTIDWTVSGNLVSNALVLSNDPDEAEVDVTLTGWLAVPGLAIEPLDINFGTIPPLCEEATLFQLVSTGEAPVTVESVVVAGDFYSLDFLPSFPITLAPAESISIEVQFAPEEEGTSIGQIVAISDDPTGDTFAEVWGNGEIGATCDGIGSGELVFDVQYERADVTFIVDNTMSMEPVISAFESNIAGIFSSLRSSIPDLTIGYARHEDYKPDGFTDSRPFRLFQQQTDDISLAVATVSVPFANISGGADWEEASSEALYQAATGIGYDQGCDGSFSMDYDVPPFKSQPRDAFYGLAAGKFDPTVPGTGAGGGMGFREGVLPIFVSATDAMMKDPERGHWTPGGCPKDASLYDAITAVNGLGGKFIGIEVLSGGLTSPFDQMEAVAISTGSYGDLDGDLIEEPTVTYWDASDEPVTFGRTIVNAIEALAAAARFDIVELLVIDDPDGVVLDIEPDAYLNIVAGTDLVFQIDVDGRWVEQPGTGISEASLELVADDSIVLAQRKVYVEQ